MARNPGKMVEFVDGTLGIAYNKEQLPELIQKKKRIFLMIDNRDFKPIFNEGKPQKVVRSVDKVKRVIGFVD